MNLDPGYVEWHCPECGLVERTRPLPNRWHPCRKLRLDAPLQRRGGPIGRLRVVEREDYIGTEKVQLVGESKRPVMSIRTERPDGSNDTVVFAPVATSNARTGV